MSTGEETATAHTAFTTRQVVGLAGGLGALFVVLLTPPPTELSEAGWLVAGVGALMAMWWITEALPIAVTSLIPLIAFPVLGIAPIDEAASPYANPLIFLFMGGFIIAIAMQVWDLHRRIALYIVRSVGTEPKAIIAGFIIASAFLSMWVSNTATALMMLPIGLSIIQLARDSAADGGPSLKNFNLVLVLSIAYACNIGGLGTLVGTPPNAFLAGFMLETYGVEVSFARWLGVGLPLVFVGLPLMFIVLTWVYPVHSGIKLGGGGLINAELNKLGPMAAPEKRVAVVFVITALLWITRPLLSDVIPGLSDAGIAVAAAALLFVIPSGTVEQNRLLTWEQAEKLPWGVLILFGGGLSLASGISETGLAAWIGESVSALETIPLLTLIVAVAAVIIFLTEITSNTATAAAFLPILAGVAIGIGQDPFLLVVPAALAASCAFMLPVATPPNAIVYGSGFVTIPEMSRAGVWLNLLFIGLVTIMAYMLVGVVFGVEIGQLPPWAG